MNEPLQPVPADIAPLLREAVAADLRESTEATRAEVARLTAEYREAMARSEANLAFHSRVDKAYWAIVRPPRPKPQASPEQKKAESIVRRTVAWLINLRWAVIGVLIYEAVKWLVTR